MKETQAKGEDANIPQERVVEQRPLVRNFPVSAAQVLSQISDVGIVLRVR
jgi:hypothetical protein